MNIHGVRSIFTQEMMRAYRTLLQSLVSPVVSTILYFIVFGAAIGSRFDQVEGVSYGSFIVPGLIMLTVMTQSITNSAFSIYFQKFIGTIQELLAAPVSSFEIVLGFVGAAVIKSIIIALIILVTANFFVEIKIEHPVWMAGILFLSCLTFSLFGFIIGVWAKNFEQLQLVPLLVVTPLVFLGGSFYSINMLPPAWQTVSLFNPVVYLISGFRWSFFGSGDVGIGVSTFMIVLFLVICLIIISLIFKTGYRIRE